MRFFWTSYDYASYITQSRCSELAYSNVIPYLVGCSGTLAAAAACCRCCCCRLEEPVAGRAGDWLLQTFYFLCNFNLAELGFNSQPHPKAHMCI